MNTSTTSQVMTEDKWRYYLRTGGRTVEIAKDPTDDTEHAVGKLYTVHYERTVDIPEELIYLGLISEVNKFTKRDLRTQGWYPRLIPDRHRSSYARNAVANFVLRREGLVPGDTASFVVVDFFACFSIAVNGIVTPVSLTVPPDDSLIGII